MTTLKQAEKISPVLSPCLTRLIRPAPIFCPVNVETPEAIELYGWPISCSSLVVMVYAVSDTIYRVFQNLIGNALKYSLEGSRIYISLKTEKNAAVADIRNTSRSELKQDVDFTARFTRGDESRTDGGSGLGLSIAKSFTEACGGTFEVETMADLFTVKVSFEQKKCNV